MNYLRGFEYDDIRDDDGGPIACRDQRPDASRNCIFVLGGDGNSGWLRKQNAGVVERMGSVEACGRSGDEQTDERRKENVIARDD